MVNILLAADEARRNKNYKVALVQYEKFLESNPRNTSAVEGLIDCLYNIGDIESAQKKSEDALRLDSKLLVPHIVLAYIYNKLGEIAKSREEAQIAFEINSNSAESLCCYGVMLTLDGDYENAVHYLVESIKRDPKMYLAHYNLSVCYQKLRDARNYHTQELILFQLKPSFTNLVALFGSLLAANNILRVSLFVIPIILYVLNLRFFLIVHIVMIVLHIISGVLSLKNKDLAFFKSNLTMALLYTVIDIFLVVAYRLL